MPTDILPTVTLATILLAILIEGDFEMERKLKRSLGKVVCGDTFWGRTKEKKLFIELKPWSDQDAVGCLRALARQYEIEYNEGVEEAICRKLGCNIPHHVQLFFDHLYERCQKRENVLCTVTDVNDIYRTEMLSAKGHAELMHYEERLKMVLPEETISLAFEMLTEAAVVGKLTNTALVAFGESYALKNNSNEEIMNIIWVLQHDGYLMDKNGNYVFVSKLLRDWWKARNEKFYIPIGQRKAK
jgi:uncharacterized protein